MSTPSRIASAFAMTHTPGLGNRWSEPPADQVERVRDAAEFGAEAHQGQKRLSGEPYIAHPVAAAEILAYSMMMAAERKAEPRDDITTKLVEDLPLVVAGQIRNVFNLAIIAPEVKTGNGYRIGGGQGSGWEMTMDGTSLTSASTQYQTERAPISSVPVDAIAEFKLVTNNYSAEYTHALSGVTSFTLSCLPTKRPP